MEVQQAPNNVKTTPSSPTTGKAKVCTGMVVAFHYKLWNDQGNQLDSSDQQLPLLYLHGRNMLLPELEKQFTGKRVGDTFEVNLNPAEAYGDHNPELINRIDRSLLGESDALKLGSVLEAETSDGFTQVRLIEMNDDELVVDGNHPFAGLALRFLITIQHLRPATDMELQTGQPML